MDTALQLSILTIVVILITLFELPKLWQEKLWKEVIVFSTVLILGTVLMVTWTIGIKIPAPFKALGIY
ncbi:MAG: hypothetical protein FH758_12545 [Firmicutes bacterium]|nr:hypothetical protein [Bacillota bacterium]